MLRNQNDFLNRCVEYFEQDSANNNSYEIRQMFPSNVDYVKSKLKNNKSPGLDNIRAELVKAGVENDYHLTPSS